MVVLETASLDWYRRAARPRLWVDRRLIQPESLSRRRRSKAQPLTIAGSYYLTGPAVLFRSQVEVTRRFFEVDPSADRSGALTVVWF
jgi:hypothetical protein